MKFCANVSILFKDAPLLDRFERAAAAGFPADERPGAVVDAMPERD